MTRRDHFRKRGRRGIRNGTGSSFRNKQTLENICLVKPEPLVEIDVGITKFISALNGFSAVIKARFSDFQVNEIDMQGEVVKLTNTHMPPEFEKAKITIPEESPLPEVSNDQWKDVVGMIGSKDNNLRVAIECPDDKEVRTNIHRTMKKYFQNKIVSNTEEVDGKKLIALQKATNENRQSRGPEWPSNLPEYTHFLLYKESIDTMNAIMAISNAVHVTSASFNYAGVKDKRAKTTQWISARRVEPGKLLFQTRRLRNIKIGNITFKKEALQLGQLKGNQFRIALRNVVADEDTIKTHLEHVQEHGFINYFGLQRFGNDRLIPTHEIGVKLLQGNFREVLKQINAACNLILKPRNYDNPLDEVSQAKKIYSETQNAEEAAKKLSSDSSIEAKLINGLAKSAKNDFVNALESVPRNMRLMYIHAFQSLIWNLAVSRRIQDFGLKPIVGDLVYIKESETESASEEAKCDANKTEAECANDVSDKEEEEPDSDKNDDEDQKDRRLEVHTITEADLDAFSIFDVVMPLPGYNITYPANSLKNYYTDLLAKYNLELVMPPQRVKCYTLSGNYRKMIQKPEDLSWHALRYQEATDTLIRSDFEEILKHKEPEDNPEGEYKALVLQFKLPASSYATMFLRELLKIETSAQTQSTLNNYHEKSSQASPRTESTSLLDNKDKFEAFKKLLDHAVDDDEFDSQHSGTDEASPLKKPRVESDSEEEGIKIQPSLV